MRADYRVDCGTDAHSTYVWTGWVVFALIGIGVPVGIAAILATRPAEDPVDTIALGFTHL